MIRVLQVLGSLQRGGAETMIMNIYRQIDRNKVQFDFLLKDHCDNGYEKEAISMGANIYYVSSLKEIGFYTYIKQQSKIMREGNYDVVHSHVNIMSGLSLSAAYLAGVKIRIAHSHSSNSSYGKIHALIGKLLIKHFSTNNIACGTEAGQFLFGSDQFTIINNGIDTLRFCPAKKEEFEKLRSEIGIQNDSFVITHIGRFIPLKNHAFILSIARKLVSSKKDFHIFLLGDGELKNNIENEINNDGLKDYITVTGSVENTDTYLKVSDLFLLPSLYEGLPVALIEAQSTGVKCIVSDKVTTEADLGVGLVEFLPLEVDLWASKTIDLMNCFLVSNSNIGARTKDIIPEYDIRNSARKIYELYSAAKETKKV